MFRAVVLFCAVLALTKGQTTEVSPCLHASSGPLPINAYIAGCDTQPCSLEQGRDAVVEIVFRAPYLMHHMRTSAWVYFNPIPFPWPLGEGAETCNYLSNTYCPVEEDEVIINTLKMPIEDFFPVGTYMPVELRIQDDSNRNIICLRTQVRIVAPANNKLGAQNSTITVEA